MKFQIQVKKSLTKIKLIELFLNYDEYYLEGNLGG